MTSKKQSKTSTEIQFFKTPEDFRKWLVKNGASSTEIIVGYYKVGTGKKSITWPQSVDEALCFGWIDGVRKRIDDDSYQIRFTPRRKNSIWSTVNIERVKILTSEGRMTEPGLQAFERRTERRSSIYAYEQLDDPQFDETELRLFSKNKIAWKHFESLAPSYRKRMLYWVVSAKQPATRARRLAKLIDSCAAGNKLMP